jgi:hypothetical protein
MIDLDIDSGAATIAALLDNYQSGRAERDETIKQVLGFLGEATQAMDLTADDDKKIEVYALTLLRQLETCQLDPASAAGDLCELRRAAEVNDPSFLAMIDIPSE